MLCSKEGVLAGGEGRGAGWSLVLLCVWPHLRGGLMSIVDLFPWKVGGGERKAE